MAAVEAWLSITREDTQHLVMSIKFKQLLRVSDMQQ